MKSFLMCIEIQTKMFHAFQLIAIENVGLLSCFVKNITNINKLLTAPVIILPHSKPNSIKIMLTVTVN